MRQGGCVIALVCVLASVAYADNKELAKEAYTEGKRHYDLGEYQEALEAFKKAYLNYEEPVFLFNIAQCYRQLDDKPAAIRSYKAFLRNWPKAPNRDMVERLIAELEAAPAQPAAAAAAPAHAATAPPATPKPAATASATPAPRPTTAPGSAEPTPSATPAPHGPAPAATTPPATTATTTPPAQAAKLPPPQQAKRPPPHEDLPGMVEIEPNFDRPSGSSKPLKWWAWTLIGVGVGGVIAAAVAVGVTQSGAHFGTTLPDFNVNNARPARLFQVRF